MSSFSQLQTVYLQLHNQSFIHLPMQKYIGIFFIFMLLSLNQVFATHQRAAEITYKWLGGLTYEITITMYTYTPSPADDDRVYLPIQWGDNTIDDIPRIIFRALPNNYTLNIYRMNHTYPAAGKFTISVEDPNRNFGVINIPNSVNVPMYVESELTINPFLGNNNSVRLLNPPIDQGCVGKLFVHNPSAYDPDGDSLSFRLVNCKSAEGLDIPGFTQPQASNSFSIDPISGELYWENPVLQGEYNVAFIVEEWRAGIKVGSVIRDMQILIGACANNPPEIISLADTCVVAGTPLSFDVKAIDPDGNALSITASGGPFEQAQNPAVIIPDSATGMPEATTSFFWNVSCSHINKTPYQVLFKARDVHPEVSLTSFKTVFIRVIAPPVENLTAEALGNGIDLNWDPKPCENAVSYRIYRRNGSSGFVPGYCETGVPAYTGFRLIAELSETDLQYYRDDNDGNGLVPGIDYCYLITTTYRDGSESLASNEACAALKRDLPVITHASNDSLNLNSGNVLLAWSPPTELDTLQFPPPYRYKLIRDFAGETTTLFTGIGLSDTLFQDNSININQLEAQPKYRVNLENDQNGFIGSSPNASPIDLQIEPTDETLLIHWTANVPWLNDSFAIYRQSPGELQFERIAFTNLNNYADTGLINGDNYCYYVVSYGGYSSPGIIHPIINYSPIRCAVPIDNVPPCPPELGVETNCETIENTLIWHYPEADSCKKDVAAYLIYFTPQANQAFQLIDSVTNQQDTSWLHQHLDWITGCYHLKARDVNGNLSEASNIVCVDFDACPLYELPNVFTPNADHFNDLWQPINYPSSNPKANVDRIELTVFNRWGNKVFETADPLINWDGKDQQSGKDCSDGTYFYVCEVWFLSFDGPVKQSLQGVITILR